VRAGTGTPREQVAETHAFRFYLPRVTRWRARGLDARRLRWHFTRRSATHAAHACHVALLASFFYSRQPSVPFSGASVSAFLGLSPCWRVPNNALPLHYDLDLGFFTFQPSVTNASPLFITASWHRRGAPLPPPYSSAPWTDSVVSHDMPQYFLDRCRAGMVCGLWAVRPYRRLGINIIKWWWRRN